MFLCLSVCVTEEHFQESYCLRDWEGGVFLLAAFGQVSLRVLGQGVVAQKVEGYSAFKMCLVTTSSRKPSLTNDPPSPCQLLYKPPCRDWLLSPELFPVPSIARPSV